MKAVTTNCQVPPTVGAEASATSASRRIDAIDWTKGALILFMVAYHAINYSSFRPYAFLYLAFLPPSFILITGFLVSQVYTAKYDLRSWRPYARVAVRGFKLLLVFGALNLIACIALRRGLVEGGWELLDRSEAIFLSGNGRKGVFEVLLPIAYFLLLAPGLLWLHRQRKGLVMVAASAVPLLCWGLELGGFSFKNLELLSAGFLGFVLGLIPLKTIDQWVESWAPAVLVYLAYRLCSFYLGEPYVIQLFGAAGTLFLLYCIARHLGSVDWSGQRVVELGQYSLLGYLAQIALLQIVVRSLGGRPERWWGVLGVALLTTLLLIGVILATQWARRRLRLANALYKAVFA
jgi:hypothetical protein